MPGASREERASTVRHEINGLETERAAVLRTILELRHLFAASLSIVYRTCGKPTCACARGDRHGPYYSLSVQSGGRNDRYHLSEREAEKAGPAIERYRLFIRSLRRLRALDRRIETLARKLQSLCETRSVRSSTTS